MDDLKRPVDKFKYIDDNIYKEDLTQQERNTIIKYLYESIFAICNKQGYFYNIKDSEDFSNWFTMLIYNRLTSPKQFGENPTLTKITSSKNYIVNVMYKKMLYWQQKYKFSELIEDVSEDKNYVFGNYVDMVCYKNNIKDSILSNEQDNISKLVKGEIEELPRLINRICRLTPYKNDDRMVHNLTMTCLLNMLNYVTVDNKTLETIEDSVVKSKEKLINKSRNRSRDDDIILWGIDDSMTSFVKVLLNRIKIMFSNNVYEICKKFDIDDDMLNAMLISNNERKDVYEN